MPLSKMEFEHSSSYEDALHKAAFEWGVEREFWDIFGNHHVAPADTEAQTLGSLGVDVSSQDTVEEARIRRFEQRTAILPNTSVVSENDKAVNISLAVSLGAPAIHIKVILEDGRNLSVHYDAGNAPIAGEIQRDDLRWIVYRASLPAETPLGYHTVQVFVEGLPSPAAEASLIVCPERAHLPERLLQGGRTAGICIALWGLRSQRNWGCGDFTDLRALTDWIADDVRAGFIGLNPLHAIHNRSPYNTSPYLPLSIFYKNFLYLDIERIPEFAGCDVAERELSSEAVQREIASLRDSEFVEYERVSQLKKRFLRILFDKFQQDIRKKSQRRAAFGAYCSQEGELLERFALYCALDEFLHAQDKNRWTWLDWPPEYRDPNSAECGAFAREHRDALDFYKYIQFVIEEQLAEAQEYTKKKGMAIGLYHDLALATDSAGADLWAYRNFYVTGCRVGSPPDAFSPKGQDWAFPPPNTIAHAEDGYRVFRASIQKIVKHGGALRIDHVMRLFRLFWIPAGIEAANGVYVKDNALDLLRILSLESVRSRNIVVGEDLGTVTDEMRETLARFGILSYRLLYFEKRKDGTFAASAEYPRQALVASTTHDLPTIAGFWIGRDIEARHAAGLVDDNGYRAQLSDRRQEKQRMLDVLHEEHLLPDSYTHDATDVPELDGILHNAVIGFLAQTPSALLLLNQEDLTKETEQQNLPGSTSQYPNWRRKMRFAIDELRRSGISRDFTAMFRNQLVRTGRAN
jgi:4-alpha-glucanotransferase